MKRTHPPSGDATGSRSGIDRRSFVAAGLAASAIPLSRRARAATPPETTYDYIVVGAGAGGGPVAARLASAGYTVAVIEAGLNPSEDRATQMDPNTLLYYSVPAFAGVAAEHPLLSWDFYVKHYADQQQQQRDSKYVPGKGILYPRGSALGGSTAHNAMLFIYPHDKDWDNIASMTGDSSWSAANMRQYFERLERCDYCKPAAPGHGFNGYMPAEWNDDRIYKMSPKIDGLIGTVGTQTLNVDLNSPDMATGKTGAFRTPMNVASHVRISLREHLMAVQQAYPDKLTIITGALASKVLLDGKRAIGVEVMLGTNLYEADKLYNPADQPTVQNLYANKEVILSAGVFNTPQLLKLSGIGPAQELQDMGIDIVVDLPGVGQNLQDRYEVTVNTSLKAGIDFYTGCTPGQAGDPCLNAWLTGEWKNGGKDPFYGPYANNAAYIGHIAKSFPDRDLPDLFIIGQATAFHGFFPGFSQMAFGNTWTWLILKAHNNNTAGSVTLRSRDPRAMPEINFHYFQEGNDTSGQDLDGIVQGVKLARGYVADPKSAQYVHKELYPGRRYQTDAQVAQYIKDESWGHHASCTARIGADGDSMAVLDSHFRVRQVEGLRVVDACVFPHIPGFFPVSSVMMIGEKASDAILDDAART